MRHQFATRLLLTFTAIGVHTGSSDSINGINVDSSSYEPKYGEDKHSERKYCSLNENLETQYCLREKLVSIETRNSEEHPNKTLKPRYYWQLPPTCGKIDFPMYSTNTTKTRSEWIKYHQTEMDNFDLREKYKTICPSIAEISNQGNCDSCWAVAAADTMTDRLCIRSNGTITRRYSTADLLSCCKKCQVADSCKGGGIHSKAWLHWKSAGIVSGYYNKNGKIGCRNYNIPTCTHVSMKSKLTEGNSTNHKTRKPQCSDPTMECPKPDARDVPTCVEKICDEAFTLHSYEKDLMKGEECYFMERKFDGKEIDIKLEILLNGPVHAFMTVYDSFYTLFSKSSGLNEVEPYLGHPENEKDKQCRGHSIRIVGWGKNKETNRSYWIAANSWGDVWGTMNGFFHLDFSHDNETRKGKELVYAGIPELPQ